MEIFQNERLLLYTKSKIFGWKFLRSLHKINDTTYRSSWKGRNKGSQDPKPSSSYSNNNTMATMTLSSSREQRLKQLLRAPLRGFIQADSKVSDHYFVEEKVVRLPLPLP